MDLHQIANISPRNMQEFFMKIDKLISEKFTKNL